MVLPDAGLYVNSRINTNLDIYYYGGVAGVVIEVTVWLVNISRNDKRLCCFILWLVLWVGVLVNGVVCGIIRKFAYKYHSCHLIVVGLLGW